VSCHNVTAQDFELLQGARISRAELKYAFEHVAAASAAVDGRASAQSHRSCTGATAAVDGRASAALVPPQPAAPAPSLDFALWCVWLLKIALVCFAHLADAPGAPARVDAGANGGREGARDWSAGAPLAPRRPDGAPAQALLLALLQTMEASGRRRARLGVVDRSGLSFRRFNLRPSE
jgi:hypothetical protein